MNCPTSRTRTDEGSYRYRPARTAHPSGIPAGTFWKRHCRHTLAERFRCDLCVTYIDHNSKTVFKGSLLGKEYSASVINRKYGTIPPEKTEEAPVIHPSEPEMKETELVEGLLDIFSLESYPYPADDLTQSPYGKKKTRKRRGPHLG